MIGQRLCRRTALGATIGTIYGLWTVAARLPADLDWTTWLGSAAWLTALLMAAGALLAGSVNLLATAAGAALPTNRRANVSAAVETLIWLPLLTWLVLNEFVYSITSEVLGAGALLLLWHNTAAVLENAWAMGARYLMAAGAITVVTCTAIFLASRYSFRAARTPDQQALAANSNPSRQSWHPARWLAGGLIVLAALLAWEIHTRPTEALTVACRTAPPLRAFNLVQSLSAEMLRGPDPQHFGPPIVPDDQYAATINTLPRPTPNIVYLLLESVPAKALHCYGYPKPDVSPNLDRLAAQGTRFEHCLAPSSFSSCSVVSLATSLYMLRGPRFDYFTSITFPFMSLTRALKFAGYELALFSSGNETFDNINRFCQPADFDFYFSHDTCDIPKSDCMRMDDLHAVGQFIQWIAARNDPRPFYCGFYLQSPHFNYEVPEPWASHYQPVPPLYSSGDGILHVPADVLPKLKNQYDNALRYADHWVGQIVDALARTGALDRTIIVAVGDHGEGFMEHGLARHGVHTWEEMIHIPLIIWLGPELRAAGPQPLPSIVTSTVSGLDVPPTLAALVGLPPHPSWQGLNVLDPAYTSRDRPVFSMTQYTRWQETACLDGIKYLYDLTEAQEFLFDLRADPGEQHNLARSNPALAAAMRQLLAGWHTYQLAYYAVPNRSAYVGRYQPDPATLDAIHHAADQ